MKTFRLFCCLCLLVVSLLAIYPLGAALAQEEEKPPEETIELNVTYPKLEANAGETFQFEVEFRYTGMSESREFLLRPTVPAGWDVYMTPQWEKEKKLSALRIKPNFSYGDKIIVFATAPFWPLPEPGEYKLALEATSGQLKSTADFTAVVKARYYLTVIPAIEGRYNTTATAGKDNTFSIKVQNLGTAPVGNINFSPTKPEGWTIEFVPDKIDLLEAIDEKSVDLKIKPPPKTIAGDYMISVRASGTQATAQEVSIRVTVESPTVWGWVGVGIILIVVVGVIVIFMRFSRR